MTVLGNGAISAKALRQESGGCDQDIAGCSHNKNGGNSQSYLGLLLSPMYYVTYLAAEVGQTATEYEAPLLITLISLMWILSPQKLFVHDDNKVLN